MGTEHSKDGHPSPNDHLTDAHPIEDPMSSTKKRSFEQGVLASLEESRRKISRTEEDYDDNKGEVMSVSSSISRGRTVEKDSRSDSYAPIVRGERKDEDSRSEPIDEDSRSDSSRNDKTAQKPLLTQNSVDEMLKDFDDAASISESNTKPHTEKKTVLVIIDPRIGGFVSK